MTNKPYEYNEWTLRRSFNKMHDKPSEGEVISAHPTLRSARAALTPDSYIFNEEYKFTVLPEHYGLAPESAALAAVEALEETDSMDEDTEITE